MTQQKPPKDWPRMLQRPPQVSAGTIAARMISASRTMLSALPCGVSDLSTGLTDLST